METGSFRGFDVELHDPGIAVITFNTPERMNGFTHEIKRDLVETLQQAQMANDVRVVVFTGSGRAFSGGGHQTSLIDSRELPRTVGWQRPEVGSTTFARWKVYHQNRALGD